MNFPYRYIAREIAVNFIGYKLRLRSLLARSRNKNVFFDPANDVQERGFKRLNFIKSSLQHFLGAEFNWPIKRVLELGPGGTMILGALLISEGIESYIAVDEFPSEVWGNYAQRCYDELLARLPSDKAKLAREAILKKDSGPITYFGKQGISAFNNIEPGSVDLIFSWGCLEHVEDIEGTLKACLPILSPSGLHLHTVSTHGHTLRPLLHLTIPDPIWNLMFHGRGHITRVMPQQYIEGAKKAGYNVTEIDREFEDVDVSCLRSSLLTRYQQESDRELTTSELMLVLTRKGLP